MEGLILLLWSSFNESLFVIKNSSFGFQDILDWYIPLVQFQTHFFSQDFMLLFVSLHLNEFKQQDLVPLQMWVLLIRLYHLKPHNLWESISKYF